MIETNIEPKTETKTDDSTHDNPEPRCPACERPLYTRHCKYVCPQHGVVFDCSDPFY